jgi:hypothetical protein
MINNGGKKRVIIEATKCYCSNNKRMINNALVKKDQVNNLENCKLLLASSEKQL